MSVVFFKPCLNKNIRRSTNKFNQMAENIYLSKNISLNLVDGDLKCWKQFSARSHHASTQKIHCSENSFLFPYGADKTYTLKRINSFELIFLLIPQKEKQLEKIDYTEIIFEFIWMKIISVKREGVKVSNNFTLSFAIRVVNSKDMFSYDVTWIWMFSNPLQI